MAINPLQIPTWQQQPDADFSPLAKLPQVYRQALQEATRRDVLGSVNPGGNLRDASMRLAQSGDLQGALTLANIDRLHAAPELTPAMKEYNFAQRQGFKGPFVDFKAGRMSQGDVDMSLSNARAAIAANPAIRDAVIQRLRTWGIDPAMLKPMRAR